MVDVWQLQLHSITTLLKNTLTLNCYLLIRTVWLIKSNQKMLMKNFLSTNIYLTLVVDPTNKKVIGKMKDEKEGKINDEFLGLKWKMHGVGPWGGILGWKTSVWQWSETLEWYSHVCFFNILNYTLFSLPELQEVQTYV